jgi:hypothetical protein
MQTSACLALLALAWLTACLPPDTPAWVINEPITWGISATVVSSGSYSQGLEMPAGSTRAEVLPHDTLELQWFGAGPEGAQLRPPIWVAGYRAPSFSAFMLASEIADCPQPLLPSSPLCRLGEGERVRMTLGDPEPYPGLDGQPLYVIAMASDGDVIEPETCLKRAFTERDGDLIGCLIATRTVTIGPSWYLWQQLPVEARPVPLDEIPAEFFGVAANTNPVIEALRVDRSSGDGSSTQLAAAGDQLIVRPGEEIVVHIELGAGAAQDFVVLRKKYDGPYIVTEMSEVLVAAGRPNVSVDDYRSTEDNFTHSWTAPAAPGVVTLYLQVEDGRGGLAFATLRFVSAPADGDPS